MARLLNPVEYSVFEEVSMNIDNYEYMKSLLTIMSPNHAVFKKNMTLTHLCVYSENTRVIRLVLDEGGDPNSNDMNNITPTDLCQILAKPVYLQLMCSKGGKLKKIQYLEKKIKCMQSPFEPKQVKFGFFRQGAFPYAFNYQNVLLEKTDKNTPCWTKMHCVVNLEKFKIISSRVSVYEVEEKTIYVNVSSEESKLNFTCSVSNSTYLRTYKLNDEVLFHCRYDPEDMQIHYANMSSTLTTWTFYDH